MKRVMLDVPDMTTLMAGTAVITNSDNPDVMQGEKPYIARASDRRSDK